MKPGILMLTTSRGQRKLCTVFNFVRCEEKGCYPIISLGHQNFDCRSYCGLSRRMQGKATVLRLRGGKRPCNLWRLLSLINQSINQSNQSNQSINQSIKSIKSIKSINQSINLSIYLSILCLRIKLLRN